MKSKSPAFQFYPKDFLSDEHVMVMRPNEIGLYVTLLCVDWLEGSIPNDMDRIARICRVSVDEIKEAWPCLAPCFTELPDQPGRLSNHRLQKERKTQQDYRLRQAVNGKLGGRPPVVDPSKRLQRSENKPDKPRPFKKETHTKPKTTESENPNESSPSSSASSSASSSLLEADQVGHTSAHRNGARGDSPQVDILSGEGTETAAELRRRRFEAFWALWTRKKNKDDARKAFDAKIKTTGQYKILMHTTPLHIERDFKFREPEKIPYPGTYLRRGDWKEEPNGPRDRKQVISILEAVRRSEATRQG